MENVSHKKLKISLFILLIMTMVGTFLMNEKEKYDERVHSLTQTIAMTEIPSIQGMKFKEDRYNRSDYYTVRYSYDNTTFTQQSLAEEIKRRLEEQGYKITIFRLFTDCFYIHAGKDKVLLDVSIYTDFISIFINDKVESGKYTDAEIKNLIDNWQKQQSRRAV